jgi:hypothetical protein
VAAVSTVVLATVACGGSLQSGGGGRGGDDMAAAPRTDETMQQVEKALRQNAPSQPIVADAAPPRPASPGGGSSGVASAPPPPTTAPADANAQTADRKIVQTATLKLQVKDVSNSYGDVTRIATTAGGFISTSNVSNSGDSQTATLSLRVPATRYQQVLSDLRALGVKVDNEASNASDVTEEYADLQSRQRNLEAAETQLLTLLGNAKTVAEVLQVQDRLTSVRGQIEQAKGRQQLLDKLSDLATISVTLRPVPAGASTGGEEGLRAQVSEAWASSIAFLENVAGAFVTVIVFLWWLPIIAIPAAIIGKRLSSQPRREPAPSVD